MKILATVLLGPGSEASAPEAIASIRERVDGFVLIESGGGYAAVLAASEAAAGCWCTPRTYAWTGDYSAARQCALDAAREAGADYALTLDPDERVLLEPGFREHIGALPGVDVWTLRDRDDGYFKERLVRCASAARWHGTVCENIEGAALRGRLGGHFWELPKTPEQHRARYERGVVETAKMIASGDDRYKWHRHRGTCLMGLGLGEEALAEYRVALQMAESPEDRAWCNYLICEQLVLREDFDGARRQAGEGLAEHAGFLPEFAWIFAYTDYKRGEAGGSTEAMLHWQNASRWAQIALNMPADKTRVSFRGKNYVRGCRNILAAVHAAPSAEQHAAA